MLDHQLADIGHGIAAHVADRDLGVFHLPVHLLDQLFAAVFGELRDGEPDDHAVVRRRDADVRFLQRALDVGNDAFVPRLNDQQAASGAEMFDIWLSGVGVP